MKKLISGMLFVAAMGLSFGGTVANAQILGGNGDDLYWQQLTCTDGSGGTYEICFYTGDGNPCDTHGETTRNCN